MAAKQGRKKSSADGDADGDAEGPDIAAVVYKMRSKIGE